MIVIPNTTFPRINPAPEHAEKVYVDFYGRHNYLDRLTDVDVPFREIFNEMRALGAEEGERNARTMAELILELARDVYCPIDTGELRESGIVVEQGAGETYAAQVEFGTRYALYVHEDLTVYHEPPTQAKFLDRASEEVIGQLGMSGFGMMSQDVNDEYPIQRIIPMAGEA